MTSTEYVLCDIHSSIFQFIRFFVCSFVHHAGTDPPSQPASRLSSHFNHSFHLFAFFHFFFIHFSFFRSFVHLFVHSFVLLSLIIDIFSLSDDTFLDTIFRIRCFKLDILKIYFCSKIDIMDGEVGISRSSHKYSPHC